MIRAIFLGAVFSVLFSTVVHSETTESLNLTMPNNETKDPTDIVLGPVDMTIESSDKEELHVNIGLKKKIGSVTYFTSTERLVGDLREVTGLSAGISWKF